MHLFYIISIALINIRLSKVLSQAEYLNKTPSASYLSSLCYFFLFLFSISSYEGKYSLKQLRITSPPSLSSGVVRPASRWPLTCPRRRWTRSSSRTTAKGRSRTTLQAARARTTRLERTAAPTSARPFPPGKSVKVVNFVSIYGFIITVKYFNIQTLTLSLHNIL